MKKINDRVMIALENSGYPYTIRHHEDITVSINSPADFATALGMTQERITKTLFLAERTGERRHALLCCSSTARVDFKAVADALDYGRLEIAAPETLSAVLGYPRSGVSPLGATDDIPVVMDESLLAFPSVLIGAGETAVEVELSPVDLKDLAGALAGNFTKV